MPRRREIPKREVLPDSVYNSELVMKFVNNLMVQGKKSVSEGIFYGAMDIIKERTGEDPMKIFKKALDNVKPIMETKSRRVGGSTYQVPMEVNPNRRSSLGMRWIVTYARGRGEKTMVDRLANELLDVSNNRGGAVKKKEDVRRMAEASRAFAHYRW
jgi:small subunit ribosomal protein S7